MSLVGGEVSTAMIERLCLRDLVAHVGGVALAFTAAGRKECGELTDTPPVDGAPLGVAAATGQSYDIDGATAATVVPHVAAIAAEGLVEGLFGPAVPVADDASTLDRILALSGRDPARRA